MGGTARLTLQFCACNHFTQASRAQNQNIHEQTPLEGMTAALELAQLYLWGKGHSWP